MNEPFEFSAGNCEQYHEWARENKKRADRLLAAVNAYMDSPDYRELVELQMAALDYEDRRG